MRKSVLISIFHIILLPLLAEGADSSLLFSRFGRDRGFPQIEVTDIQQDSRGNLWFASREESGVFRYDGYDLKSYDVPTAKALLVDSRDRVYISDSKSFFRLDGEIFVPLFREEFLNSRSLAVREMSPGRFLLTSLKGAWIYEEALDSLEAVTAVLGMRICSCACKGDDIYMGIENGDLLRMDIGNLSVEKCLTLTENIQFILPDVEDGLWLATRGRGLYHYGSRNGGLRSYRKGAGPGQLQSDYIRCLCFENDSTLWIGTLEGLDVLHTETGDVEHFSNILWDDSSLSHNTVRNLFRDNQGGMWVGTYFGGLNYWHPSREMFRTLKPGPSGSSLNDMVASCVQEAPDGTLWIGTNKGGVNLYDPRNGFYRYYLITDTEKGANREFNDVKAICCDSDNRHIYIGAHGAGLNILDRRTGVIRKVPSPEHVSKCIDGGDELWVCSYEKVYVYDKVAFRHVMVQEGRFINGIFKDSKGCVWVLRQSGISQFRKNMDGGWELDTDPALTPISRVTDMIEDTNGIFWILADSALYSYDSRNSMLEMHLSNTGYPLRDIELGSDGAFWFGTQGGIVRYESDNGSLVMYTSADGISSDTIIQGCHCKATDGSIYYGGIGGVTVFSPLSIKASAPCPAPVVSSVIVNGTEEYSPEPGMKFKSDQNHLAFRFSGPDYLAEGANTFIYKLEGFDRQWFTAGSERMAVYSNLPKGTYHMRVKMSRRNNDWTECDAPFTFRVLPPWYRTTLAIILEFLLVCLVIVVVVHYIIRQRDLENQVAMHDLEKKHQKELTKLKALQFVNATVAGASERKPLVTELSPSDERFLTKAMSIMEANLSNTQFTAQDLADKMGFSRTTLHKQMKSATGDSALAFIHKMRFSEACRLLRETDLTVSEISYRVGAVTPAYFCTSFKKYVGCSPLEYAERNRENNG